MNTHRFIFDHSTNPEAFPNLMEASEYLKSLPIERRRELEEEWHG